uniref:Nuclear receptor domain-containing protein n=1 Tax=Heterorhabditis bacteriophora TaxID=37862 RepID=A0A1I7X8N2_HETBA
MDSPPPYSAVPISVSHEHTVPQSSINTRSLPSYSYYTSHQVVNSTSFREQNRNPCYSVVIGQQTQTPVNSHSLKTKGVTSGMTSCGPNGCVFSTT